MKTEKNRRLKGSVLFTVVCVMSLLIIFLMGTLVLAASTNRRAHKSYSSSQTSYTTRAAIESFASAMEQEVAIASAVENLGATPIYPQIEMPDGRMGHIGYYDTAGNFQEGRIKIECLDDAESQYYYDNDPVDPKWVQLQTVKVTATARLGGEESTTVAYIRKKAPNEPTPLAIKGLQTVGGTTVNSGGMITGGLGLGIASPVPASDLSKVIRLETDMAFINSALTVSGAGIDIHVTKPGTGTVIMGDVRVQNSQVVTLDYEMIEDYTQNKIPYLYVDGQFSTSANAEMNLVKRGSTVTASDPSPYNLFFGSINLENNPVKIESADLYLMDSGVTSKLNKQSGSYLKTWADSTFNKTEAQHFSTGGNIYSKGNLELAYIEIDGDIRVEGNLIIGQNVTIKGDVVVGGTLDYTASLDGGGNTTMKIEGDIYANATNPAMTINAVVDGITPVANIPVPETKVIKEGYKAINNKHYDYIVETVDHGTWTQTIYKDHLGNACWPNAEQLANGYYMDIDLYGNELFPYSTPNKYSYYTDTILEEPQRVNEWDAVQVIPAHYHVVDATGVEIVPETDTTDDFSYFDATGNRVAAADAVTATSVRTPAAYGDDIYPAKMTREEITGLGDPNNKIVTTLKEMQEAIGYSTSTNAFNPSIYHKDVPDSITFPTSASPIQQNMEITTKTWLTGSMSKPKITIKPNGATLWIKLTDVSTSNDAKITIDTSAGGTVNFLVDGTLSCDKWVMKTTDIKENCYIYSDFPGKTNTEIDINWFGSEDSKINVVNNSTFLGTAKMPYTVLTAPVSGAYNVYYNDVLESNPVWIGNALFEGVDSANQFKLLYTGASGSGDSDLETELGMWHINYFDQY